MATKGNTELNKGIPKIEDAFVIIVKTEWNAHIADRLEEGCIKVLKANGVQSETVVVPGSFEIPFVVKTHFSNSSRKADAYIALGAVIRGDTPHFDYVCKGVTNGVMQLNIMLAAPTVFAVLTVNNEEQAEERIGGVHGHKGEEAAVTAIKMIALKRSII